MSLYSKSSYGKKSGADFRFPIADFQSSVMVSPSNHKRVLEVKGNEEVKGKRRKVKGKRFNE